MFVGGLRALVLQALHPLAMAGVAEHSGYRGDPWGRLQRTSRFLAATTFGPIDVAERTVAKVRAVHRTVHGTAPDGRSYRADDPHLLRWVHVAEVDSFLRAHRRFGDRPLSAQQADEYVAEVGFVSAKLGVIDPPQSVRELKTVLAAYRPELRGTPEARDTARFLLFNPPVPLLARPAYGLISAAAVAMLPGWAPDAPSAAPGADRRRGRRPPRRRAGDPSLPLDVGDVGPCRPDSDLTRRKHCGNQRETGPPYGCNRAVEPPPTRPPSRWQRDGAPCAPHSRADGAATSTTSRRACWPSPPRPPSRRRAGTIRGPRR